MRKIVLLLRYDAARAQEVLGWGVFIAVDAGFGGGGDAGRATAKYFQPEASPLPEAAKSKDLYEKLTATYPMAEKAVIDLPALAISGQALMKYNRAIGQTLVWSRMENLPRPEGKFVRLWLKAGDNYTPAGIAEWVKEGETAVAYSVFVRQGNLEAEYQDLVVSYDSVMDALSPEAPVVTLKF